MTASDQASPTQSRVDWRRGSVACRRTEEEGIEDRKAHMGVHGEMTSCSWDVHPSHKVMVDAQLATRTQ